jgi:hypothetical protein
LDSTNYLKFYDSEAYLLGVGKQIMQQRKQTYWEFSALFVAAWGAKENFLANRLF